MNSAGTGILPKSQKYKISTGTGVAVKYLLRRNYVLIKTKSKSNSSFAKLLSMDLDSKTKARQTVNPVGKENSILGKPKASGSGPGVKKPLPEVKKPVDPMDLDDFMKSLAGVPRYMWPTLNSVIRSGVVKDPHNSTITGLNQTLNSKPDRPVIFRRGEQWPFSQQQLSNKSTLEISYINILELLILIPISTLHRDNSVCSQE